MPSTHQPVADQRLKWWQRLTRPADDQATELPEITESAAVEDLFDVTRGSLLRCGFATDEFEMYLIGGLGSTVSPTLLVELDETSALVWAFATHLETYLIDRVRRHGSFSVDRIVFTPKRQPELDMAQAHDGVRLVWSALQARRGQQATDAGPDASHPNMNNAAISAG